MFSGDVLDFVDGPSAPLCAALRPMRPGRRRGRWRHVGCAPVAAVSLGTRECLCPRLAVRDMAGGRRGGRSGGGVGDGGGMGVERTARARGASAPGSGACGRPAGCPGRATRPRKRRIRPVVTGERPDAGYGVLGARAQDPTAPVRFAAGARRPPKPAARTWAGASGPPGGAAVCPRRGGAKPFRGRRGAAAADSVVSARSDESLQACRGPSALLRDQFRCVRRSFSPRSAQCAEALCGRCRRKRGHPGRPCRSGRPSGTASTRGPRSDEVACELTGRQVPLDRAPCPASPGVGWQCGQYQTVRTRSGGPWEPVRIGVPQRWHGRFPRP